MACPTAARITGSPTRLMAPRRTPAIPGWSSSRTRPVSNSAQVEAFTNEDDAAPRCLPQSDGAILSSISASIVSASGTRSIASAKHMSATPSCVDNPYSARKNSIRLGFTSDRIRRTKPAAMAETSARTWSFSAAVSTRFERSSRSSANFAAVLNFWSMVLPQRMGSIRGFSLNYNYAFGPCGGDRLIVKAIWPN